MTQAATLPYPAKNLILGRPGMERGLLGCGGIGHRYPVEVGLGLDFVEEIGRASCRERVCQYVSISVVAVSLKKKNNQQRLPHSFAHIDNSKYHTLSSHAQISN